MSVETQETGESSVEDISLFTDLPDDNDVGPWRETLTKRPADEIFPLDLEELVDLAKELGAKRYSPNTILAHRKDWASFLAFCERYGRQAFPASPQTVAVYLAHLNQSKKKSSTIGRHLATISVAHQRQGVSPERNPTRHSAVREVWAGIRRDLGTAKAKKHPALLETLRMMVDVLPDDDLAGKRDRALILVGFAGALRRSEIVGLTLSDITFAPEGLTVLVRQSKTDQEASGRKIGIPFGKNAPTCPVRNLQAWLHGACISEGPLFRKVTKDGTVVPRALTDDWVARIVKRTLTKAGIDPKDFAGHSLRAGLATQAARGGASKRAIQRQTGHKSLTILREYIREGDLFRENAVDDTGL